MYPAVDQMNWGTSYRQRPLLFHNDLGKLKIVPAVAGTGLAGVSIGRGLAYGDLFNDGHIDALMNNMDGAPTLLRNVVRNENHWVELKLIGGHMPRDGVGAVVYLTADGFRQRADVVSGGSFASSSDPRLHFGLGVSESVDKVEVHWPGGAVETVKVSGADGIYTIVQGSGVAVLDHRAAGKAASVGAKTAAVRH